MTESRAPHWTDAAISALSQAWHAGATAKTIAAFLGQPFTRNMVIGKARRMGLPSRQSPIIRFAPGEEPVRPKRLPTVKRRRLPKIPVSFKTCQWIDGQPTKDDSCKCGQPATRGAYCDEHYRQSYNRVPA